MAHLSAMLQITPATSQEALQKMKTLYFEYRDLKARRQAIEEAEAEAEAEADAGAENGADVRDEAGWIAAPDACSVLDISPQDKPVSRGMLHFGTYGLPALAE